jgi:signal transduction histidine kinase
MARPDEIGTLARSLAVTHQWARKERALRVRDERLATLGRIATSLAHEIKNPAAAIRLHVDLLSEAAGADAAGPVGLIRDEIDRITDLVNQWLFVARAAPPRVERHDLVALAGRVVRRLEPQLRHAGVTASVESDGPVSAAIDAPRVEQVVRNLLLNATQAMAEGGIATVTLTSSDGQATLEVRDTGPGFSASALQKWHEPFFSEREGGMGLGMTLAAEVIRGHGGSVVVENAPDRGAVVRCTIPTNPPDPRRRGTDGRI